jgi:hypothetical protein
MFYDKLMVERIRFKVPGLITTRLTKFLYDKKYTNPVWMKINTNLCKYHTGFCENYTILCERVKKNQRAIRFDPSIPDLGDLAIPHAIVSVNKLFNLFYTIHYYIFCGIFMTK